MERWCNTLVTESSTAVFTEHCGWTEGDVCCTVPKIYETESSSIGQISGL